MEETQKDEDVREDQGETNENAIIEDFERSSTVEKNVGKASEKAQVQLGITKKRSKQRKMRQQQMKNQKFEIF